MSLVNFRGEILVKVIKNVFCSILLMLPLSVLPVFASVVLGPVTVSGQTTVDTIYTGVGPTYVTFRTSSMAGCNGKQAGYLLPTWASAMGGTANQEEGNRMLSVLLAAKTTNANIKVNFRVNSNGTGWDKCAISGITLL